MPAPGRRCSTALAPGLYKVCAAKEGGDVVADYATHVANVRVTGPACLFDMTEGGSPCLADACADPESRSTLATHEAGAQMQA